MERGPRGAGVKTWTFRLFLGEAGAFGGSGRRRHGLPLASQDRCGCRLLGRWGAERAEAGRPAVRPWEPPAEGWRWLDGTQEVGGEPQKGAASCCLGPVPAWLPRGCRIPQGHLACLPLWTRNAQVDRAPRVRAQAPFPAGRCPLPHRGSAWRCALLTAGKRWPGPVRVTFARGLAAPKAWIEEGEARGAWGRAGAHSLQLTAVRAARRPGASETVSQAVTRTGHRRCRLPERRVGA